MIHAFRTTQRVVVCALLSGAIAMAQSAVNKTDSTAKQTDAQSGEHHSKMSKLAFWRHHSDTTKDAKQAAKPTTPKQTTAAQLKAASADQSQISKAQVRTVAHKTGNKQDTGSANQKQRAPEITTASTKPPAKKTTAKAQSKKPAEKSTTAQDTALPPSHGLLRY